MIERAVSNAQLQELVVDHPVDITRMLTSLCERGLLVSDNRRWWATYELSRCEAEASLFDADDPSQSSGDSGQLSKDLGQLDGDGDQLSGKSGELAGDSVGMAANSVGRGADLGHLAEDSGRLAVDLGHMGDDVAAELKRLAAPVASRGEVDSAAMVATIRVLCSGGCLTTAHLADLLRRRPDGVRKRFLTRMVRDGLLRQKYPQATNRPDQAYTAAGEK